MRAQLQWKANSTTLEALEPTEPSCIIPLWAQRTCLLEPHFIQLLDVGLACKGLD